MASLFNGLLRIFAPLPKPEKKKYPKVSDYMPAGKNSNGEWCTPIEGEEIIRRYYRDIRGGKEAEQAAVNAFFTILKRSEFKVDNIFEEFKKDVDEAIAHSLSETQEKFYDEEDRILAIEYHEDELRQQRKALKKVDDWSRKKKMLLQTDCRSTLRATLMAIKDSETDGHILSADYVEYENGHKYPELPDSYY